MNDSADPRERFGKAAELYLTSPTHSDSSELAEYVSWVAPIEGDVLDVGTGAGHTAFAFASAARQVVARDITQAMLDVTAREAQKRGLSNLSTNLGPAESLDFADGSYEGVTCRTAAHHFDSVASFLSESFRVLEPGGWILIVDTVGIDGDPSADDLLDKIERMRDPSHRRDYTPLWWHSALEETGFAVEKSTLRSRDHDGNLWFERMQVGAEDRRTLLDLIFQSEGNLREYLQPVGTPESWRFNLSYSAILARKPHA